MNSPTMKSNSLHPETPRPDGGLSNAHLPAFRPANNALSLIVDLRRTLAPLTESSGQQDLSDVTRRLEAIAAFAGSRETRGAIQAELPELLRPMILVDRLDVLVAVIAAGEPYSAAIFGSKDLYDGVRYLVSSAAVKHDFPLVARALKVLPFSASKDSELREKITSAIGDELRSPLYGDLAVINQFFEAALSIPGLADIKSHVIITLRPLLEEISNRAPDPANLAHRLELRRLTWIEELCVTKSLSP